MHLKMSKIVKEVYRKKNRFLVQKRVTHGFQLEITDFRWNSNYVDKISEIDILRTKLCPFFCFFGGAKTVQKGSCKKECKKGSSNVYLDC